MQRQKARDNAARGRHRGRGGSGARGRGIVPQQAIVKMGHTDSLIGHGATSGAGAILFSLLSIFTMIGGLMMFSLSFMYL